MKKLSLFTFAAALFAFGFAGSASADGDKTKWGWGECEGSKILSVENESLDQSVAESTMPEGTEPAETTKGS